MLVFETRRLDEWEKTYETHKAEDSNYKPSFWDLLRVHLKDGFRQHVLIIPISFLFFLN